MNLNEQIQQAIIEGRNAALNEQSPPMPGGRPRRPALNLLQRLGGIFGRRPEVVPKPHRKRPFVGPGNKPHNVNPFAKADAILDKLTALANQVYDNLGQLFSDFFEELGPGYTGAFDAFRTMLRNMYANPGPVDPNAAASLLDYLYDADVVISISEDGTQMFFSHNAAGNAQNDVIDVFFNGAIDGVDGLLQALIDAFPDSLYGG